MRFRRLAAAVGAASFLALMQPAPALASHLGPVAVEWSGGFPYVNSAGTAVTWQLNVTESPAGVDRILTVAAYCWDGSNAGNIANCGSSNGTRGNNNVNTVWGPLTFPGVSTHPKIHSLRVCDSGVTADHTRPSCGSNYTATPGPDVTLSWLATTTAGVCDFGSGNGAWANGTLKVAWQYKKAIPDAGVFDLRWPAPSGNTWTPLATAAPTTTAVAGYPAWYMTQVSVASIPNPPTVRVALSSDHACLLDVVLGSDLAAVGPTGGSTGSDPDDGGSCGLNPFCHIKAALRWAFVPGDATEDAWNGFKADVEDRAPASLALAGSDFLDGAVSGWGDQHDNSDTVGSEFGSYNNGGVSIPGYDPRFALGGGNCHQANPLDQEDAADCNAAAQPAVVVALRNLLRVGVWVGLFFVLWRRSNAALGSKPEGDVES